MFKRFLIVSSGALVITLLIGVLIYAGWLGLKSLFSDYFASEISNRKYEACGIAVNQSVKLSGYDLQGMFDAGFDCDDTTDICLLDCLQNGGAAEISGGCFHLCKILKD